MATSSTNKVQLIIGGRILGSLTTGLSSLNKQLGSLGSIATTVGGALAGLFAVQRMASFASAAIEAADALGKLAEKTGIGVDALGQLSHVFAQEDVELGSLQIALKSLSVWLVKTGQAGKPLEHALLEQAEAFSKMDDGAAKAAKAVEIFGRAGIDMLPFLNRGPDQIRELMVAAQQLGTITADQAKQADAWGDSLGNAKLAAEGLARSVAGPLLDAMTPLVEQMAKVIGAISKFVRDSPSVQMAIRGIAQALTVLTAAFIASTLASKAFAISFGAGAVRNLRDFMAYLQLLPAMIQASSLVRLAGWVGLVTVALEAGTEAWKLWKAEAELAKQTIESAGSNLSNIKQIQALIEMRAAQGKLTAAEAENFRQLAAAIREDISQAKLDVATTTQLVSELAAKIQQTINTPASGQDAYLQAMAKRLQQFKDTSGLDHYIQKMERARALEDDEAPEDLFWRQQLTKEYEAQNEAITEQIKLKEKAVDQAAEERKAQQKAAEEHRRAVIASTYAGQAAQGFHDFQEQREAERGTGMGGMGAGAIAGLQNAMVQLGTAAQQVGQAITSVIGGAVQGIAGAIEGLIRRTMTWKDALVSVGMAILDSIIGAIAQMLAQMLVGFLMNILFGKMMAVQAKQLAASWAPAAFFASVATYGTAVGVGVASLTAGLGTMTALSQFAEGGFTGPGPKDRPVGIVHAGEYVIPARTVNEMGIHHFDALLAGHGPSTAPAGGKPINQSLNVYFDQRAWMEANRDSMEAVAVDAMRRNSWRVG